MPTPTFTIRFRIAELMQEQSITPKALAEMSGLNYRTILNVMQNKNVRIELTTLGILASVMKVAPGDLLYYQRTKKERPAKAAL